MNAHNVTGEKTPVRLSTLLDLMLHYWNSKSRFESIQSRPTKRSTRSLKEDQEQVNGAERNTSPAVTLLAAHEIIRHILQRVHLRYNLQNPR